MINRKDSRGAMDMNAHFSPHVLLKLFLQTGLVVCLFFSVSPKAFGFPHNYQVISRESIKPFSFYEDQPWQKTPKPIEFRDLLSSGNVVILHFWATSCPSCVNELKALEKLAAKRHKNKLSIVVVSLNDPRSGILRNYFMRNHYAHLKPYHRVSGARPAIKGLPTTFFFNRSGYLVGKIEGVAPWHSDEMDRLLTRLCEEPMEEQSQDYNQWSLSGIYEKLLSFF